MMCPERVLRFSAMASKRGGQPSSGRTDRLELVLGLVHKLQGLPEPAMRLAVLAELAGELAPLELAPVLDAVLIGPASGIDVPRETRLAVVSFLASDLLAGAQREELLLVALSQRLAGLARALHPGEGPQLTPAQARALKSKGRPLTLGERRSLAAGWDRRMLQRLLSDLDPLVVERLLVNPRLREEDVIALALLSELRPVDLRVVASNHKLDERVRAGAEALLRSRSARVRDYEGQP
jgi:hypothetical protein